MPEKVGPYEILSTLGRGGMGTVYEALDERTGRRVALKVLPKGALSDPELEERFRQECGLAGRIEHPHVLPVYDYDVNGRPYIAMRVIKGTDLASEIKKGPLPPERAVTVMEQVASALDAAHQQNLRHRDVKPSNVLLEPGSRAGVDHSWLFDWGIAQTIDISRVPVTRNGQIVGTPAYVAPERLRANEKPDHRADVYSLAVVLYECLAGVKPFESDDDMNLLMAHLNTPPPPLPPHLPAGLQAVVAKGLAKMPEDRYQTAPELAEAARAAIDGTPPPPPPPTPPVEDRSAWPVAAAGVGGLVVAGLLLPMGLVDVTTLAWAGPMLAVASMAFTVGLGGLGRQPDGPPALPHDQTRDFEPGGVPPPPP
ncbi:serine/threonine-protein kinase [Umezawaea sp. NPDC059074]|uniref:serine/threonine-protein kinase n=1 Tax=Umezawaea sp. NPDC059074 TaxID=3346716 RepID=UPI0036CDC9E2